MPRRNQPKTGINCLCENRTRLFGCPACLFFSHPSWLPGSGSCWGLLLRTEFLCANSSGLDGLLLEYAICFKNCPFVLGGVTWIGERDHELHMENSNSHTEDTNKEGRAFG